MDDDDAEVTSLPRSRGFRWRLPVNDRCRHGVAVMGSRAGPQEAVGCWAVAKDRAEGKPMVGVLGVAHGRIFAKVRIANDVYDPGEGYQRGCGKVPDAREERAVLGLSLSRNMKAMG